MNSFSKFLKSIQPSVPYNCYEVGHTWTPGCNEAAAVLGYTTLKEALKIYSTLYLTTYILQRKYNRKELKRTLRYILISSCFLGFNFYAFQVISCRLWSYLGGYHYWINGFFPGFLSSYLAILIERDSRWGPLALYTTNVASDVLFCMATERNFITPFKYGEVILFGVSVTTLLFLARNFGYRKDVIGSILRLIIGNEEVVISGTVRPKLKGITKLPRLSKEGAKKQVSFSPKHVTGKPGLLSMKHPSCPHDGSSCLIYCLKGIAKPFLIGLCASTALTVATSLPSLFTSFREIARKILSKRTFDFALLLGSFSGAFKISSCLLRWLHGSDASWHAIPAGIISGLPFMFFRNRYIALYIFWKTIETVYLILMEYKVVPNLKNQLPLLYAISLTIIAYAAVLEPHNINSTYLKFLDRLANSRLRMVNRPLLDVFGTQASKMYQDTFIPALNVKYTSPAFQNMVMSCFQ